MSVRSSFELVSPYMRTSRALIGWRAEPATDTGTTERVHTCTPVSWVPTPRSIEGQTLSKTVRCQGPVSEKIDAPLETKLARPLFRHWSWEMPIGRLKR